MQAINISACLSSDSLNSSLCLSSDSFCLSSDSLNLRSVFAWAACTLSDRSATTATNLVIISNCLAWAASSDRGPTFLNASSASSSIPNLQYTQDNQFKI